MENLVAYSDPIKSMIEGPWNKDPSIIQQMNNDYGFYIDKAVEYYNTNDADLSEWSPSSVSELYEFADQWLLYELIEFLIDYQISFLKEKKAKKNYAVCVKEYNDKNSDSDLYWFLVPENLIVQFRNLQAHWIFKQNNNKKMIATKYYTDKIYSKDIVEKFKISGTHNKNRIYCYSCLNYYFLGCKNYTNSDTCVKCSKKTLMTASCVGEYENSMVYHFNKTDERRALYDQEILSDKSMFSTLFKWTKVGEEYHCNEQSQLQPIDEKDIETLDIIGIFVLTKGDILVDQD